MAIFDQQLNVTSENCNTTLLITGYIVDYSNLKTNCVRKLSESANYPEQEIIQHVRIFKHFE